MSGAWSPSRMSPARLNVGWKASSNSSLLLVKVFVVTVESDFDWSIWIYISAEYFLIWSLWQGSKRTHTVYLSNCKKNKYCDWRVHPPRSLGKLHPRVSLLWHVIHHYILFRLPSQSSAKACVMHVIHSNVNCVVHAKRHSEKKHKHNAHKGTYQHGTHTHKHTYIEGEKPSAWNKQNGCMPFGSPGNTVDRTISILETG